MRLTVTGIVPFRVLTPRESCCAQTKSNAVAPATAAVVAAIRRWSARFDMEAAPRQARSIRSPATRNHRPVVGGRCIRMLMPLAISRSPIARIMR
jgi:hypothetical protein